MTGDVYLFNTFDGGEIEFRSGEPIDDQGLETAVYISIFSYGWWANSLVDTPQEIMASEVENIIHKVMTPTTLRALKDAVTESIKWIIDEGIVTNTRVSVTAQDSNRVLIEVTLDRPQNQPVTFKFYNNWEGQQNTPAHQKR